MLSRVRASSLALAASTEFSMQSLPLSRDLDNFQERPSTLKAGIVEKTSLRRN